MKKILVLLVLFFSLGYSKEDIQSKFYSYNRSELRNILFSLCMNILKDGNNYIGHILNKNIENSSKKSLELVYKSINWVISIYTKLEEDETVFTKRYMINLLDKGTKIHTELIKINQNVE